VFDKIGEAFLDDVTSGRANDVADEEYAHWDEGLYR
jgi:hypothetical protein